jgi:glyoxylate/hydroxypyruvate reductase A
MLHIIHPTAGEAWAHALRHALPNVPVSHAPATIDPDQVEYLVCWRPPAGSLAAFTRLRAVFATGAGIDQFLARPDLAPDIPLIRLTDAGMAEQMFEYVLYGTLHFQRNMDQYGAQQAARQWQPFAPVLARQWRIGVLGLGTIGGMVACRLAAMGYCVSGWSRSARQLPGVVCMAGAEALDGLLADCDLLINILPNTPTTDGLLDRVRLGRLPKGAAVINAGRGQQLDLDALQALLADGHLRGALLDVFPHEPLPAEHPLWHNPKVLITPHIAAATLIPESATQIAAKIADMQAGRPIAGVVDRQRGY